MCHHPRLRIRADYVPEYIQEEGIVMLNICGMMCEACGQEFEFLGPPRGNSASATQVTANLDGTKVMLPAIEKLGSTRRMAS